MNSTMDESITRPPVSKMSFENVRGDAGERRKARVRQGPPKAERTKRNSERMQDQQEQEEHEIKYTSEFNKINKTSTGLATGSQIPEPSWTPTRLGHDRARLGS